MRSIENIVVSSQTNLFGALAIIKGPYTQRNRLTGESFKTAIHPITRIGPIVSLPRQIRDSGQLLERYSSRSAEGLSVSHPNIESL